jgi:2-polyprenyl-6-methoxyphenol hydroxylase-like FAD-dependent oxidoreductase
MNVAVVGAGPGGLMAALMAARAGFNVACYEAKAELSSRGCWILGHPAQEILQKLGLELSGRRCRSLGLETADQERLYQAGYAPGKEALSVRRQTLLDRLYQECLLLGVKFRFSTRLESPPEADLIVGADGCRSRVREWAELKAHTRSLGHYYRGEISKTASLGSEPREIWTSDGRRFGLDPCEEGVGFYCTAPAQDPEDREAYILGWESPLAQQVLRSCDWRKVQRCRPLDVWCLQWSRPPYFLVGDAAHGQPPNLGQGANLALLDSYLLFQLIERNEDLDQVAIQYQKVRGFFTHRLHFISVAACWFSHFGQSVRNTTMQAFDNIDSIKPWLLSQASCENSSEKELLYD